MTRTPIVVPLGIAIAFQLLVLTGMVAKAAIPLWVGTEIQVKTEPVDPRSMFRGNYARLRYEFGTLPEDALEEEHSLRMGEFVYVSLQRGEEGQYEFAAASTTRPTDGIFLRGRLQNNFPPYFVKYGIEAFFAPEEKAQQLERNLREGGTAILMVTGSGQAALQDVISGPNTE